MDMRGLSNFIKDIRKANNNRDQEQRRVEEELAKIRAKFLGKGDSHYSSSSSTLGNIGSISSAVGHQQLSPYDRKKYMCKLMFISMLGYKVEFGHMEGIVLLSGASNSEKLIGYLSLTVFLHEHHELMTLTTHTIHTDLTSRKEFNMCLALTAIANVGGKDFVGVMVGDISRLIIDSDVSHDVRKKAILTMLRMYRKDKDTVTQELTAIVPYVTVLICHPHMGLSGCAVSFILGILLDNNNNNITDDDDDTRALSLTLFKDVPAQCVAVLEAIIVNKATDSEYMYYSVPAPWLQCKVIRLLRHLPCPTDQPELLTRIASILGRIITATDKVIKTDTTLYRRQRGTQSRVNILNAILVEVISLIVCWDCEPCGALLPQCMDVLSNFINDPLKDSNLRYMGLSLITRLSSFCVINNNNNFFNFYEHTAGFQEQVVAALYDTDISIRKRALELLQIICNNDNADRIILELLEYLSVLSLDNITLKEGLIMTIALLAEKYCSVDMYWYSAILLSLCVNAGSVSGEGATATTSTTTTAKYNNNNNNNILIKGTTGGGVPKGIWHRLLQVVIDTPHIQRRVTHNVFDIMYDSTTAPDLNNNNININNKVGVVLSEDKEDSRVLRVISSFRTHQQHYNETIVKIGAFLLGEFGYRIATDSNNNNNNKRPTTIDPMSQASVLVHALDMTEEEDTKIIIITALAKLYSHFTNTPTVRAYILCHLRAYICDISTEIQQRAIEYVMLIETVSDDVLRMVLGPMPPFGNNNNNNNNHLNEEDNNNNNIGVYNNNSEKTVCMDRGPQEECAIGCRGVAGVLDNNNNTVLDDIFSPNTKSSAEKPPNNNNNKHIEAESITQVIASDPWDDIFSPNIKSDADKPTNNNNNNNATSLTSLTTTLDDIFNDKLT